MLLRGIARVKISKLYPEVMLPHIFISSTFTKVTFKRAKPLEYHLRGVAEQVICIVLAAIKARVYPINESSLPFEGRNIGCARLIDSRPWLDCARTRGQVGHHGLGWLFRFGEDGPWRRTVFRTCKIYRKHAADRGMRISKWGSEGTRQLDAGAFSARSYPQDKGKANAVDVEGETQRTVALGDQEAAKSHKIGKWEAASK
ncbi:hypothetical protein DFP72DRAFT_1088176 [Ephemerocybe angulata]|uniref:Uncharacterized protein n=1 Tax=Ephemerocybe angulata TaxID=980116 RepID=A0A8H6IIJ4_9AGAR|nr:hypothetical protein DFP72DRAFT_1088176 [Tulosesus angulatus]